MPENEKKELNPQEIAEQRKVAQEKAIKPVDTVPTTTAVVQDPSEAEQAITKAYDNNIKNTELLIKGWEGKRANAVQQDEIAQRKSRNMQMIAGLSDGLASLANLIGVADRGTNIDMGTGALTPLQQKMEAARLERKADIKSIDDRLEQYRQQLLNMQLAKGKAVASQKATEAELAEKKSAELRGYKQALNLANLKIQADKDALKAQQTFQAEENDKMREHQKTLTEKEIQGRKDIAAANNEADVKKYTIRYGTNAGKDMTKFVMDDPITGEQRAINIGDKSLNNILATYLPMAVKLGEITEEEAEDAKNWRSNEVSKTNLLGMVNKSKVMREALLLAAGEEPGTVDGGETPKPTYDANSYMYQPQGSSWQDAYPDPSQK